MGARVSVNELVCDIVFWCGEVCENVQAFASECVSEFGIECALVLGCGSVNDCVRLVLVCVGVSVCVCVCMCVSACSGRYVGEYESQ
jgi:hypothetical protein